MTDEIFGMMKRKQQTMPNYGTEYKTLHDEIRNKCTQKKEEWLNEICAETERMNITEKAHTHLNNEIGKMT